MGTWRRFARSLAAGALASVLAACGMAPASLPLGQHGPFVGIYARQPQIQKTRRFGMVFDRQTPRVRYIPGHVNAGLPAKVDLRSKLSPIDDQGDLNSCTGFAIAGLAEYRAGLSGQRIELSPGFIYVMELKLEDRLGDDGGARITTGMQVLKRYGIAPEAVHPYLTKAEQKDGDRIVSYLKTLPTTAAFRAARPFRVPEVKPVENLVDFKTAIAKGHPVVFGFAVYSSGDTDEVKKTGIIPMPNPDSDGFLGGHAILAVGYDDAKQHVIFKNSYGLEWGDKGYGYLPYAYFQKELVGDAWEAL